MTSAPAPDRPITIAEARNYLTAGVSSARSPTLDPLPLHSLGLLRQRRDGLQLALHPPPSPATTRTYMSVTTQLRPEQVLQFAIIHGVHVNRIH